MHCDSVHAAVGAPCVGFYPESRHSASSDFGAPIPFRCSMGHIESNPETRSCEAEVRHQENVKSKPIVRTRVKVSSPSNIKAAMKMAATLPPARSTARGLPPFLPWS